MIVAKTPLRVSFVGGGSDLKKFYQDHKGATVSMGINRYIYTIVNQGFDDSISIRHSKIENAKDIYEIQHPLIKMILHEKKVRNAITISVLSDIHAKGSGLGSSSSLAVGLINALSAYNKKKISKAEMAEEASRIEIELLKNPIGKQDQYAAAFGGLNFIEFHQNDTVTVSPIKCKKKTVIRLEENLILFYTGIYKPASIVLSKYQKSMEEKEKKDILIEMVNLAYKLRNDLEENNLDNFGSYLHQNWLLKKQMESSVSNKLIDKYYNIGLKHGALGGKILGAGGRGYILFYAPKKTHVRLIKALHPLLYLKVACDSLGSRIIDIDIM